MLSASIKCYKETNFEKFNIHWICIILYWLRELRFGKKRELLMYVFKSCCLRKISCLLYFFNAKTKQSSTFFCCLMLVTGLQRVSSFCFLVSCSYKFFASVISVRWYVTAFTAWEHQLPFTCTGQHELFCTLINT